MWLVGISWRQRFETKSWKILFLVLFFLFTLQSPLRKMRASGYKSTNSKTTPLSWVMASINSVSRPDVGKYNPIWMDIGALGGEKIMGRKSEEDTGWMDMQESKELFHTAIVPP